MKPSNKGHRNQITELKFKKRLQNLGLTTKQYCYKAQGKPCSCYGCSPDKYNRAKTKALNLTDLQ